MEGRDAALDRDGGVRAAPRRSMGPTPTNEGEDKGLPSPPREEPVQVMEPESWGEGETTVTDPELAAASEVGAQRAATNDFLAPDGSHVLARTAPVRRWQVRDLQQRVDGTGLRQHAGSSSAPPRTPDQLPRVVRRPMPQLPTARSTSENMRRGTRARPPSATVARARALGKKYEMFEEIENGAFAESSAPADGASRAAGPTFVDALRCKISSARERCKIVRAPSPRRSPRLCSQ